MRLEIFHINLAKQKSKEKICDYGLIKNGEIVAVVERKTTDNFKKQKFYNVTYIADILADLFVTFPGIQFVFCDNRKLANEWVYRWFKRINGEQNMKNHPTL